jgi:hypothetical protein
VGGSQDGTATSKERQEGADMVAHRGLWLGSGTETVWAGSGGRELLAMPGEASPWSCKPPRPAHRKRGVTMRADDGGR